MYVSNIFVDRFGRRSNLRIDGLSGGLTVFFGPQHSGKTTLVDFLRAMWTGFDGSMRERYLPADSRGFGGVVTIQSPHGRQTISRYDDGGHEGRLTVEREDGALIGRRHVQDLIGNVSASLVELAFIVDFQRRPQLADLLQLAIDRGFPLCRRATSPDRLLSVERMIAENRNRLARLAQSVESPDVLRQCRRDLLRDFDSLTAAARDESGEQRQQLSQLEQEIDAGERLANELRQNLQDIERSTQTSQGGKSTVDKSDRKYDLSRQLRAIDKQIARWTRTLRGVIRRKRRLAARCNQDQRNEVAEAAKKAAPRLRLAALESRIRELDQSLSKLLDQNDRSNSEIRATVSTSLEAMRKELYQLCDDLSRWQFNHRYRQVSGERAQLARCEVELRKSVHLLGKRRNILAQQLAPSIATGDLGRAPDPLYCQCAEHPHPANSQPSGELTGTPTTPSPLECSAKKDLPLLDPTVEELRRFKHAELQRVSEQLTDKRRQLLKLKTAIADRSRQIDALRAELDRVKDLLRNGEQQLAVTAEIARLEAEHRKLREEERIPALVHDASRYLCRLTSGEWTSVHVASPTEVWIETARGRRLPVHEMNSGSCDQVYLAICLAVVVACERDGIHLPVVLNAPFSQYPASQVHPAIELLRDFAHGRQILCLTSDASVLQAAQCLSVSTRPLEISESASRPAPKVEQEEADAENLHDSLAEHYLSELDPIERVPWIDEVHADRLKAAGIERVRDLLRVPAATIAGKVQFPPLSAEVIFDWQSQARLMCGIHALRPYDARVLVACGITDPNELRAMSSAALRARVRILSSTPDGQATILSGSETERARVIDWIRSGPSPHWSKKTVAKAATNTAISSPIQGARRKKKPHAA